MDETPSEDPVQTRPPSSDPKVPRSSASAAALSDIQLPPPGALLDLVNQDLRGVIDEAGAVALRTNPHHWLGVLYSTLKSVEEQIATREQAVEKELANEHRIHDFATRQSKHSAWRRKVEHFRLNVIARIDGVRLLIPEDDVRAVLLDGCKLDVRDSASVEAWQARARRLLAL